MKEWRSGRTKMVLLACLVEAVAMSWASPSGADEARPREKRACAASYEKAQQQHNAGKLRRARAMFLACARPACGDFIDQECTKALTRLDSEIPSVVLLATNDSGESMVDVQVTMDGELLSSRLDGRAVAVDPGVHQFAFKTAGGAEDVVQLPILQGERNRVLSTELKPPAPKPASGPRLKEPAAPAAPATRVAGEAPRPAVTAGNETSMKAESGSTPAPYVVGGVGVAGVAAFSVLYVMARNDNQSLTRCWPTCSSSQVNAVRLEYIAAEVSLGVGIAALGTAAAWLYLGSRATRQEPSPAPHYAIDVKPSSSGLFATVSGAF